jgi:hypothetical protein
MKASDRVAFSPGEFAALFGKSQTWGYRQIYAGRIKAITEFGRMQIPAAEVERVLESAGIYNGLPARRPRSKAEIQGLAPKMPSAWEAFLAGRRESGGKGKVESRAGQTVRAEALGRLTAPRLKAELRAKPPSRRLA